MPKQPDEITAICPVCKIRCVLTDGKFPRHWPVCHQLCAGTGQPAGKGLSR